MQHTQARCSSCVDAGSAGIPSSLYHDKRQEAVSAGVLAIQECLPHTFPSCTPVSHLSHACMDCNSISKATLDMHRTPPLHTCSSSSRSASICCIRGLAHDSGGMSPTPCNNDSSSASSSSASMHTNKAQLSTSEPQR